MRPEIARRHKLGRLGTDRTTLEELRQPFECSGEIRRQFLEAQQQRVRPGRRVPGQQMPAPRPEMQPAGYDIVQAQIIARGVQEFPKAAAAGAALPDDIDRLAVVTRPFMGLDQWQPKEIGREQSVRRALEMTDMLRDREIALEIVRIDAARAEAETGP